MLANAAIKSIAAWCLTDKSIYSLLLVKSKQTDIEVDTRRYWFNHVKRSDENSNTCFRVQKKYEK